MAIYEVVYQFSDEEGRNTDRTLYADVADESALLTAAATMLAALEGFSKSGVTKYTYRRVVLVNEVPAAGSNIDAGATFVWNSALPIDPTSKLPDPVDAVKNGQGGIDLANALTLAYTDLYTAGPWRLNKNTPTQPTSVRRATLDV